MIPPPIVKVRESSSFKHVYLRCKRSAYKLIEKLCGEIGTFINEVTKYGKVRALATRIKMMMLLKYFLRSEKKVP